MDLPTAWTCFHLIPEVESSFLQRLNTRGEIGNLKNGLSSERDSAEQEIRKLRKTGSAQALVGDIILGWAKSHLQDPLLPEALHRVVMVVRYGCHQPDPQNGRISKAAFDLLHEQYPKNNWTMKTPYWFN